MKEVLTLATRRSGLALRQAELARAQLQAHFPRTRFEILELVTTGDKKRRLSMEKEGGKGLFTKELEDALLAGRADLAVHSAKDLPTTNPDALALAAFLPREAVNDVLVRREGLARPGLVATSSPRRRAQCRLLYPDCAYTEIRGNVDTRLRKIARGDADATLLARAGLARLGIDSWDGLAFDILPLEKMVPAVGQGAIALQSRAADADTFATAGDAATGEAVTLERAFLRALGGGCHTAFGGHLAANGCFYAFHEDAGREERLLQGATLDTRLAEVHRLAQDLLARAG